MKEQDIDRLFREAFHEAEETPSQNAWLRIEKQLSEEKVIVSLPNRKYWAFYAAAILLLIGIGLTFMKTYYISQQSQSSQITSNKIFIEAETDNSIKKHIDVKPEIVLAIKTPQKHRQSIIKQKGNERTNIEIKINKIEAKMHVLDLIDLSKKITPNNIPVHQVNEVEDLKPLIELEEETKSMYANTDAPSAKRTLITTILNSISEQIEISDTKNIRFRADEEGSLSIDILHSLVKNRNKKRK